MSDPIKEGTTKVEQDPVPDIEIVTGDNPVASVSTGDLQDQSNVAPDKFRTKSPEDVLESYKNLERKYHERDQELAALRKAVELVNSGQQPAQGYATTPPQGYDQEEVNRRFQQQLEQDTFGTMANFVRMVAGDIVQQQFKQQQDVYSKYYQYAQNPEFSDVANDVAQVLPLAKEPIDPIEGAFLRAKLLRYEKMLKEGNGNRGASDHFVEGASSARKPSPGIRVEIENDPRVNRFDQAKLTELAKMVAKQAARGKTMDSFDIDDWRATR